MAAPTKKEMRSLDATLKRGAPRPKCACCGKAYGRRNAASQEVRWDAPSRLHEQKEWGGRVRRSYITVGEIPPPPPYRGNGVVIKETSPYISADDGRAVMTRWVWDGETYSTPYKPFCTLRCALHYARKAYARSGGHHHG
jgi:hypothetical protein